ncbi:MAG: NUDIX domain-containing protein [Kofleriaceae bacterium]
MKIEIVSDDLVGTGGYYAIRRFSLRNVRDDGSRSEPYNSDAIVRPHGQDAVVCVLFARVATGVRVLVRDGLRPTVYLLRDPAIAPLPEGAPGMFVTELVAGVIEPGDSLADRAAAEIREEAGFIVEPASIVGLGAGMFGSPGPLSEKEYFVAVEVDPAAQLPLETDGTPMEEAATTRWLDLDDAIAACVRGEINDLRCEIGLRRLRDALRNC